MISLYRIGLLIKCGFLRAKKKQLLNEIQSNEIAPRAEEKHCLYLA